MWKIFPLPLRDQNLDGGTANMANFQAQQRAVADPRNKPILDTIKQAIA